MIAYREQGYDDNTIISGLQQQGWTHQQVLDAITQASQKSQQSQGPVGIESNDTEAIVESVVEEKWQELLKKLQEINDWRDKAESRITTLEQQSAMMKENFDKLHEGVLGKISEYDSNLQEVGTSIKAMDQVFKKVLPTLTESVNKLDRMASKANTTQRSAPVGNTTPLGRMRKDTE